MARVVANYKDKLPKFFKRYQIQPVWRADRPARGRYREFYQCDVDAIGSSSMIVEAELISAVCEILDRLGFEDFVVKVNHREILGSLMKEVFKIHSDQIISVITVVDKFDKIGIEGVENELLSLGIDDYSTNLICEFFHDWQRGIHKFTVESEWNNNTYLQLYELLAFNDCAIKAVENIDKILTTVYELNSNYRVMFDPSLARGLSYYTGAIFEIKVPNLAGSLGGGGRYDGLIGMFGKEQIPACGFSLGLERILVVMEERGMFDKLINEGKIKNDSADVMVACFDENLVSECLKLANDLRIKDLRVLVYPEANQKAKPYKYAEQIKVPFVCLLRESDLAENKVAVKNMLTGEQEIVAREGVAEKIKH